MRRGEVWRVRLPPGQGHVQSGIRPAVIILNDAFHHHLVPTTLIVPFTSRIGIMHYPGTYLVQPSPTNGLTMPSVAMAFQARVLDQRECVLHLGDLDPHDLARIMAQLDLLIH